MGLGEENGTTSPERAFYEALSLLLLNRIHSPSRGSARDQLVCGGRDWVTKRARVSRSAVALIDRVGWRGW